MLHYFGVTLHAINLHVSFVCRGCTYVCMFVCMYV